MEERVCQLLAKIMLTFDHFGLNCLIRVHCLEPVAHGD